MMERFAVILGRLWLLPWAIVTFGIKNPYPFRVGIAISLFAFGCNGEKKSLYGDLDHVVPNHWPSDVTQAGQMMKQRLEKVKLNGQDLQTEAELLDLISWAPEIAADTDLGEEHWQPIYDLSESLHRKFLAGQDTQSTAQEIEQLCNLLLLVPSQIPSDATWTIQQTDAASNQKSAESSLDNPVQDSRSTNDVSRATTGRE